MKRFLAKILIIQILGALSLFAHVRLEIFRGCDILPFAAELADISHVACKELPCLHGFADDPECFVARHCHSSAAILCLALDGCKIVGFMIGSPLRAFSLCFQQHFIHRRLDVDRLFHIGGVGLLPEFRCRGIEQEMLLQIERLVRREQVYFAMCLASIDEGGSSWPHVWTKMGFVRADDLSCSAQWPHVWDLHEPHHALVCWIKSLQDGRWRSEMLWETQFAIPEWNGQIDFY
jgi:GNAT superfamily N-acetyltransferase